MSNLEDKKIHSDVHDEYSAEEKKDGVHSLGEGVKGEVEVQQVFSESSSSVHLSLCIWIL